MDQIQKTIKKLPVNIYYNQSTP